MRMRTLVTKLYLVLIIAAEVVMWGEYLLHCNDPGMGGFAGGFVLVFTGRAATQWPALALMEALLGLGVIPILLVSRFKVGKTPPTTILWGGLSFFITCAAEFVGQLIATGVLGLQQLSFSTAEQLLFYLFAPETEETAFRGALLGVALYIILKLNLRKGRKLWAELIAVLVQSGLFAAIHASYYSQLPLLLATFAAGIAQGFLFLYMVQKPEKIGGDVLVALIIGHFIINLLTNANLIQVLLG